MSNPLPPLGGAPRPDYYRSEYEQHLASLEDANLQKPAATEHQKSSSSSITCDGFQRPDYDSHKSEYERHLASLEDSAGSKK
ncbi:MAG: hypothetical protein KDK59_07440 [Simkania sp.]|nr:hypothetical protein [Simkania sp.]